MKQREKINNNCRSQSIIIVATLILNILSHSKRFEGNLYLRCKLTMNFHVGITVIKADSTLVKMISWMMNINRDITSQNLLLSSVYNNCSIISAKNWTFLHFSLLFLEWILFKNDFFIFVYMISIWNSVIYFFMHLYTKKA